MQIVQIVHTVHIAHTVHTVQNNTDSTDSTNSTNDTTSIGKTKTKIIIYLILTDMYLFHDDNPAFGTRHMANFMK